MCSTQSSLIHKHRKSCLSGADGGRGMGELVFNGDGASVWKDDKVWRWMVVMFAHQCGCAQCHSTVHLKMANMANVETRCLVSHRDILT